MCRGSLVPALALFLAGCPSSCLIQRTPALSHAPPEVISPVAAPSVPTISQTAPTPQHAGKGIFGDEIEYLGFDTQPAPPRAGRQVLVTYYFHALKTVDHDWQIFVHADEHTGRVGRINGDHYPGGGALHTDQWKAGQYIADRFAIDLPESAAKSQMDLWTGFYQGDARLPITNPKECTNDGNNRLLAGTLNIE